MTVVVGAEIICVAAEDLQTDMDRPTCVCVGGTFYSYFAVL